MECELLNVYANLKHSQWKSLQKFILGSHSKSSDTFKIFTHLRQNWNEIEVPQKIRELRLKYFPDINQKRFLNLLSNLNLITEDYLILDHHHRHSIKKEILLHKIYNDKGLFKKADTKARRVHKMVDSMNLLSLEKDQYLSRLLHQQYYSDNPIKYKNGEEILEKLVHHELVKTKIQLLVYKCELVNWGSIRRYDYSSQINCIREISRLITVTPLSEYIVTLENLLTKPNLDDFLLLRNVLYENEIECPSDMHTIFTLYLLNSSLKLWHQNLYNDADESVKIFEYALSTGVLLYNGKIPIIRFHNLISTLGALKTYEWTQDFIKKWVSKVEGKNRSSTVRLAKAQNAFEHDKYEQIIPLIRGVEFENNDQKLRALGLELLVLFIERKQDYSLLRNYINNFKRTLKRLKPSVSDYFYKSHLNLIKIIELLIKRDFTRVTINLKNYNSLIYRTWLDKQI